MIRRLLAALMLAAPTTSLAADPLPPPTSAPVLTVGGAIDATNADGLALFDRDMLAALPRDSFTTTTIWTSGPKRFTGVLLKSILDRVGARGEAVRAVALNDYAVTIPMAEIAADAPLVAYELDGAAMSVRDRGPLWIIYPFDSEASLRTEVNYSRSVWQLTRLDVLE